MAGAQAACGPNLGRGLWARDSIGLGAVSLMGPLETQPLKPAPDGLLLSASARLDNSEDLSGLLGIPPAERARINSDRLILEAYRKWGTACCERLLGDWTIALWDPQTQRLLLARDQHGTGGLYYYQTHNTLAFASSLKGLLVLPWVPRRLDEYCLAKYMVSWPLDNRHSCYQGIYYLAPAQRLVHQNGRSHRERYWFMERLQPQPVKSEEQILENFLELYAQAVRSRLSTEEDTGILLSGGLDSGSLAALAAPEMGQSGRRLAAFSSVPKYDPTGLEGRGYFGDERPFVQATADFVTGLELHFECAENTNPLEGVRNRLAVLDQPGEFTSSSFWVMNLFEHARRHGVRRLLVSEGGNATISWMGKRMPPLLEFLRGGSWGEMMDSLRSWQEENQVSIWRLLRSQILYPLLPEKFARYRWLKKQQKNNWQRSSPISLEFVERINLPRQLALTDNQPPQAPQRDSLAARMAFLQPGSSRVGAYWGEMGAAYQMQVSDPTLDIRLVTFCLGLPESFYRQGDEQRLLVRQAMRGRLPEQVLDNPLRGLQAADLALRMREPQVLAETRRVLEILQGSSLAPQMIDLARLSGILDALEGRPPDARLSYQIRNILLRGLMAGLFLLRFEGG